MKKEKSDTREISTVAIYGYPSDIIECIPSSIITTSCSSAKYTRDVLHLGMPMIYAARLDDPATKTFKRCSSDSFQVNGVPCAYQICYVYLYRTGPDGWKPESLKIYDYNSKVVMFYYNTFILSHTWFGFNYCSSSSSHPQPLTLLSLFRHQPGRDKEENNQQNSSTTQVYGIPSASVAHRILSLVSNVDLAVELRQLDPHRENHII
ncbi:hypothetical protein F8388_019014 [Cannabis sativa]|uniref:Uncharacterized protein n=1 Tax=Cannabis sativa TaxID=3483 RepID=A0A7J6H166_CANSA|nr:hypothetical protein F8388_019014 [Cannabis sativa]